MEWKTVVATVLVVSLFFLAIPIKVGPNIPNQDVKLFEEYVARYNKSYRHDPTEYDRRFEHFQKSLRHITKLNALRTSQDSALYGPTEFSDLSEDEFLTTTLQPDMSTRGERYLSYSHRRKDHSEERNNRLKRTMEIPPKFDWRDRDVITSVRSQGSCGACWAFSTIEVAESMFAIKNGTLRSFSVQEMIDCARNTNFGCEGGDICSLLAWLVDSKVKIVPESNYPFTWKTGLCELEKLNSQTSLPQVTDFTCNSFVDAEDELLTKLAKHGPVAAAVNALTWQNYLGGVIQYHCDGSFDALNHAVQIVGYDNTAVSPFYIVRNSWGSLFGDNGYVYIEIGKNLCGIANQVSSLNVI